MDGDDDGLPPARAAHFAARPRRERRHCPGAGVAGAQTPATAGVCSARRARPYLRSLMMKLPNDTPSVWPLPLPVSASEIEPLVTTCAFDASPAPALASAVA